MKSLLVGKSGTVALVLLGSFVLLSLSSAAAVPVQTFKTGSLIIPMDTDYQDRGMLTAFGLVNKLLASGIPVYWCVDSTKSTVSAVDFTASAIDVKTSAVITNHGYRGGPFVVDAAYQSTALAIVVQWQAGSDQTAVHSASADFTAPVSRVLVKPPIIAVLNDGNTPIAFAYLNAARIPDSLGSVWTLSSPGVLTPVAVAGPTTTNHRDGALFDINGQPLYTQLVSSHWTVQRTTTNDEAIAEIAQFLTSRTHVLAECQSISMVEDDNSGHFVSSDNGTGEPAAAVACGKTPDNGLCVASQPADVSSLQPSLVFAQFDGTFKTIGGSQPAFGLAPASAYFDPNIVMLRSSTSLTKGTDDIWSTGYAGGSCQLSSMTTETEACAAVGKVSYLGGHQYTTSIPISTNPTTQGARLFLQSLFETGSQQPTTTTIISNINPSSYGQSVTFTATVAPLNGGDTPNGTVSFLDGTASLGNSTLVNGQAVFITASLGVGSHSITAVYGGSIAFAASTSAVLTQVVNNGLDPAITSANTTAFTVGTAGLFTITTTGAPTPSISESGTLPGGVSFVDNGNGTASLSGTPMGGTDGIYSVVFTASNGVPPDFIQNFTLDVLSSGLPAVSVTPSTLTVGSALVGLTSHASKPITLTNTGSGDLLIASGGIVASGNFLESDAGCQGTVLAPNASCTMTVTITPSDAGSIPGAITITDNAPDSPQVVGLTGTGLLPLTFTQIGRAHV